MSYFRRRGMSGIAEYGILSTTAPKPPPPPPPARSASRAARVQQHARARGSLGSLDADETAADPEMTEVQWRAAMLASQREVTAWQERWVKRDELQRWLQFGATLAIPLSAAIWRMIFRAGRKK